MGMDVYSESGIVCEIDDVLPIFESFTETQVKNAVDRLTKKHDKNWPTNKDDLKNVSTNKELYDWFVSGVVIDEESEEGFDCYHMGQIWDQIMSATKSKLPPAQFNYWTSSRLSDYEVPIETPCIVFHEHGLFVTKMSAKGKKLAAALGKEEITSSTWTVLSY